MRRIGWFAQALVGVSMLGASAVGIGQQVAPPTQQPTQEPTHEIDPSNITAANWYWGPANRWSWHNTRRLFPSDRVGRGDGPVLPLPHDDRDLSGETFTDPISHKKMTVAAMLDATYTDGFLVLFHGKIVMESYRNGLTADQPHLLMSMSKSVMGTLAGILMAEGKLDPNKLVTDYIPEMRQTLYDGATVRNLLDMSVADPLGVEMMKTAAGTAAEYQAVDEAGGWLPERPTSAPGLRAYLIGQRQSHGADGKQFQYLDQSAILIGWVMERATGEELPALVTERIWSKLGAEQDAYMLLDRYQQSYSSAGLNATLRDLGRFGVMMAENGVYNGKQIVPEAFVKDIRSNGQKGDVGLAAPAPWPGHAKGTYRNFWWNSEHGCGRFTAVGLGGQLLVVDPVADVVVVKFDSTPAPQLDEGVFQTEYKGIDAVIKSVSGHGCS